MKNYASLPTLILLSLFVAAMFITLFVSNHERYVDPEPILVSQRMHAEMQELAVGQAASGESASTDLHAALSSSPPSR